MNINNKGFYKSGFDELDVCNYNKNIIEWADRVDIIWDNRSSGTIFDFGMAFALGKQINIQYIEKKTFKNLMYKYMKSKEVKSEGDDNFPL